MGLQNNCFETDHRAPVQATKHESSMQRIRRVVAAYAIWRRDRAAFEHLRHLDDRRLRDIGLIRSDVEEAALLPIWRNAAEAARDIARERECKERQRHRRR